MLQKRLRSGKSGMAETAEGRVFLTVHVPPPRLVIIGAVHISQALAPMARLLGYDVTIVDPRTAFATPERFPDVPVIAEWPDEALPPLGVDRYTAFVALTHDPKIDDPALLHALARDCFYIGALGSKKTHARRVERLKAQGASEADLARIHAPIGLAIGAVSPPEIAVAIMGEITAACGSPRRQRRMKFGPVPVADAEGAIAVHSIRAPGLVLKKGTVIGEARDRGAAGGGHRLRRGRRLEPRRRAGGRGGCRDRRGGRGRRTCASTAPSPAAPTCSPPQAGVLVVDDAAIDKLNQVDEAITLATLPAFEPVVEGEMIATVKIIPFAVEAAARDRALAVARGRSRWCAIAPYRMRKDRHRVDAAAGPRRQGRREDAEDHGGALGARGRRDRRGAARSA